MTPNWQDYRESAQENFQPVAYINPFAGAQNLASIARGAYTNRREREEGEYDPEKVTSSMQSQFDNALTNADFNTAEQLYGNSQRLGLEINTRGAQIGQTGSGSSGDRQAQANRLLNQAAGLDTTDYMGNVGNLVNQQARQSTGVAMSANPMQDMGLRNEGMDPALAQQLGLSTQLSMQNSAFESDLAYKNAIRSRPISRDIAHQQNDAQLAMTRENNRASIANSLLNTMAQQGNTWANFYKMG